jgi:peptidoglycan/xylan/chitin deacetylase (PgdA/CDA1 family)
MTNPCAPLRVLTYHRIATYHGDPLRDRPQLTVTPEQFQFQMRTIAKSFHVVSLDEVLEAVSGGRSLPARAVLVTFDDAYSNVGTVAWPIMRELGLPATIFVATGFPALSKRFFWWDRLRAAFSETVETVLEDPELGKFDLGDRQRRLLAYKRFRNVIKDSSTEKAEALVEDTCRRLGEPVMANETMDWDEIKKLANEGVQFAAHSRTHPILTQLDEEALENELSQPLIDLKLHLGSAPPVLAYPSGCYNNKVLQVARSLGYKLGFTTEMRNDRLCTQDNLAVGRLSLSIKYSAPLFRLILMPGGLQLIKGYTLFNDFRKKILK